MTFFVIVIFLIFAMMIFLLYKYILDVYESFKPIKKKSIKVILFFISIILFISSILLIFRNKVGGVLSVFLIYIIMMYFFILIINIFLKKNKKWRKIYLFIPVLFSLLFTSYGLYNMKNIVKTEYTIYSDKLNNDYKAILLSDLHYGVSLNDNELKKYCDEISELNPDFVFLGGDIVDERTSGEEMKSVFNILSSINSKYGIYYIYGNHDKNMYSNNKTFTPEELERTIRNNNIIILQEDKKYINDDVILIGRGYNVRKNLDEIISDEDSSLYSILIDHVPLEYKPNREKGINLELSGHTHNGQIFPLGLMQKAYNFIASDDKTDSEINNIHNLSDLVYGIYQKDDFTAIVSSGMAGWAIPIRTESRSEYVVINIKSKN